MPVYWDKKKQQWRYSFNRVVSVEGSKRRKRATKLLPKGWSRDQAEEYDRVQSPKHYAVASGIQKPQYLIAQAVQHYKDDRCPSLRNGHKVKQELLRLLPYYAGRSVEELAEVAAAYRKDNPDLAPATFRNRMAYLRSACRYAHAEYRWKCPEPNLRTPAPKNRRESFRKIAEQRKVWNAFEDDEARAMFTLAYFVGARWRSELLPRVKADIIRDGKDVWLNCGLTKNGKPKWKWVPTQARWALKYIPFQWSDTWFYDRWRAVMGELGIKDFVPHDQRHSLASKIINEGGSLPDVAAALGHESLAASARYSHLYPDRVKSVMKKHGKA